MACDWTSASWSSPVEATKTGALSGVRRAGFDNSETKCFHECGELSIAMPEIGIFQYLRRIVCTDFKEKEQVGNYA